MADKAFSEEEQALIRQIAATPAASVVDLSSKLGVVLDHADCKEEGFEEGDTRRDCARMLKEVLDWLER
jgi:hypothetical protein